MSPTVNKIIFFIVLPSKGETRGGKREGLPLHLGGNREGLPLHLGGNREGLPLHLGGEGLPLHLGGNREGLPLHLGSRFDFELIDTMASHTLRHHRP
jgi:hypothetical protein